MRPRLTFLAFFSASCTIAQEMETDRPDQSDAATLVPSGWAQFESGIQRSEVQHEGLLHYPQASLRIGLTETFEMRVFEEGATVAVNDGELHTTTPLEIGGKFRVLHRRGTKAAVVAHIAVPRTGAGAEYTTEAYPRLRGTLGQDIGDKLHLLVNAGLQWNGSNPTPHRVATLSLSWKAAAEVRIYGEVYGILPDHYWNAGLSWQVLTDLQVDGSVGHGFTTGDRFLALGLSWRLRFASYEQR